MKIVTTAEMREIDRETSERFGMPSLTLMENAGSAVAEFALEAYPSAKSFGVICGKGNNGGDGFVVARKLHEAGKEVRVVLLGDPKELRGDAAQNYKELLRKSKSPPSRKVRGKDGALSKVLLSQISKSGKGGAVRLGTKEASSVFDCDVLIDAILGSGFRPPVSGAYTEAIAKINSTSAPVIAVDIPSGADSDVFGEQTGAVARADAIVTFTSPRPAHVFGNLTLGPIVIAPIGSPEDAIQSSLNLNLITPKDIVPLLAPRPRNSNKGMYGHVLVVGGALGKAGAAAMAGFSALRSGAGLVTVATARSVLPTVAGFHPELMTEPLAETADGTIALNALGAVESLAENKTVLAIGPGISRNDETAELVRRVVGRGELPIVLDADGLNAFEGRAKDFNRGGRGENPEDAEKTRTLVLTPHPGEMARLNGMSVKAIQRDRINVARSFALERGVILVLKGDRTIVAGPDGQCWVNPTGNPGMATGGTGDVLTGMVAGMLAQNPQRRLEAVIAAVYLHGLAGDIACMQKGEQSLVATDLIQRLPEAFRQIRAKAAEKWVKIGD
jgi:ADP-dependent NAD(P)H-hydrate dehydratase / NAD(P)H-hydrate epimerase